MKIRRGVSFAAALAVFLAATAFANMPRRGTAVFVDSFVRVGYGNGDAIHVSHTGKPQTTDGGTVLAMDLKLIDNPQANN